MAIILPILLFLFVAAGVSCAMVAAPRLIAPRKRTAVKEMPYEAGMDPIHDTRRRFAVRFHLVAIAFLVFDVELLFLYPWAVAAGQGVRRGAQDSEPVIASQESSGLPNSELGMRNREPSAHSRLPTPDPRSAYGIDLAVAEGWVSGRGLVFAGAMVFILLVVVGFVYDWRKGVFQWR